MKQVAVISNVKNIILKLEHFQLILHTYNSLLQQFLCSFNAHFPLTVTFSRPHTRIINFNNVPRLRGGRNSGVRDRLQRTHQHGGTFSDWAALWLAALIESNGPVGGAPCPKRANRVRFVIRPVNVENQTD